MPGYLIERSDLLEGSNKNDVDGIFQRRDCMPKFTGEENLQSLSWLRSFGWEEGEPFVCLHLRDDLYLQNLYIQRGVTSSFDNSFRDTRIDNYLKAIEYLTSKGVWVIRTGKVAQNPIPMVNPRVIDYPFLQRKSDLLDIWIFSKANAIISNSSGPDVLASVNRIPLLVINGTALTEYESSTDIRWHNKIVSWMETGDHLSLNDLISISGKDSEYFRSIKIQFEEATSEEVYNVVSDFWNDIHSIPRTNSFSDTRQNTFWNIISTNPRTKSLHGFRHEFSRIDNYTLDRLGIGQIEEWN